MPTKNIRTLSNAQIGVLRSFPIVGRIHPAKVPSINERARSRTWNSLQKKGLISWNEGDNGWIAHWGFLSEFLYNKVFPGTTRQTYHRELERLNSMALDFSSGSNVNFMRQITVVRALRETLIKAEAIDRDSL